MSDTKRVVIVGAGVVGLSTAYYAALKGHQVTVLERETPEFRGCSFGNAGMIVPSHFVPLAAPGMVSLGLRMLMNPESPFWFRPRFQRDLLNWAWTFMRSATAANVARAAPILRDLHLASRACYEELAALPSADLGLVKKGLLMLCESETALRHERELADMSKGLGLPGEVLNAEETAQREPGIRMNVAGSVFYSQDCHVVPDKVMDSLARLAESAGATIKWGTSVERFSAGGGRILAAVTSQGEHPADEFVVAGGSWSPQLLRPLGIRLPVLPGKGYSLTLPNPRRLPTLCGILVEGRVAMTPMDGALRFAGTMELGARDLSQNPRRIRGIIRSVCRAFPDFTEEDFESVEPWCGLRPCSPDGLPYIGRFRRFRNLSAATGHAMMGLSLAPVTGKLIASVLSNEPPPVPLDSLTPDRFSA